MGEEEGAIPGREASVCKGSRASGEWQAGHAVRPEQRQGGHPRQGKGEPQSDSRLCGSLPDESK